jgi:hypothetical protein
MTVGGLSSAPFERVMTETVRQVVEPSPSLAQARMKGSHVRQFFVWYTEQGGQERTARLLYRVAERYRQLFDPKSADLGILDSTWYPAESIHSLVDGIIDGLTPSERTQLARDGARIAIQATLRGVYRWLFEMMMTPERYVRKAQTLFSRYNEPGVLTKTETAPHTHLTVVRGWTGHHPYMCELLFYSGIAVYEAMGCRNVVGRRLGCVSEGATECSYTVRWDE